MGKAARKRRKDERMRKKRAMKMARRALYASLAGTSKKRKRIHAKSTPPGKFNHETSNCGNVGCKKCFPRRLPVRRAYAPSV